MQVDIDIIGLYCPKGARVTHKQLHGRSDIQFVEKSSCVLCAKVIHTSNTKQSYFVHYQAFEPMIGSVISWPRCKDARCYEKAPCLKSKDPKAFADWRLSHDCLLERCKYQNCNTYMHHRSTTSNTCL